MALAGQEVTIIGAGVGGLTAALALAQRGARVRVLEQAEALRELGAGLQISPNAAAVLQALGLGPALEAASLRARAVVLRDGLNGDEVMRLDLDRLQPGLGYHFLHRADLIALLARAVAGAGAEISLLHGVDKIDLSGARPRWTNVQGEVFETPLLIGADGLHSRLRPALNGPATPFFTGQIAWRALVPAEPGAPAEAEVHMGPGRHLVSYPLRGGALRNIVAVEERSRWVEEGWSLRDDPMEMRLAFAGFSPRVRTWLDAAEDVWLWGLFRHEVAACWGRVGALGQGAAMILGDAAHPTLPFLAQGAAMAIEDGYVLADCLDRLPLDQAIAAYQAARLPRCRRIVAAANGNARAYHLRGPLRALAHLGLRLGARLAPKAPLARFDWLYRHDVTQGVRP